MQRSNLKHLLHSALTNAIFSLQTSFTHAFLLASRIFISSKQLLTKLHHATIDKESLSRLRCVEASHSCPYCKNLLHGKQSAKNSNQSYSVRKTLRDRTKSDSQSTLPTENRRRGRFFSNIEVQPAPDTAVHDLPITHTSRNISLESILADETLMETDLSTTFLHHDFNYFLNIELDEACMQRELSRLATVMSRATPPLPPPSCNCLRRKLLMLVYEWVSYFPADFRSKSTMWTLNGVIQVLNRHHDPVSYNLSSRQLTLLSFSNIRLRFSSKISLRKSGNDFLNWLVQLSMMGLNLIH